MQARQKQGNRKLRHTRNENRGACLGFEALHEFQCPIERIKKPNDGIVLQGEATAFPPYIARLLSSSCPSTLLNGGRLPAQESGALAIHVARDV